MAETETHEHTEPEQSTPADSSLPPEQEERIVDKVVGKVKEFLDEVVGGGAASDGGDQSPRSTAPATPAATEADFESKVREGVAKEITRKERQTERQRRDAEHQAEHERLAALAETPPKTFSKLTTAIWGSDDS